MAKEKSRGTNWSLAELEDRARTNPRARRALVKLQSETKIVGLDSFSAEEYFSNEPLQIDLPLPVGVNALYANVPGVGRVLTEEGRAFKNQAVTLILSVAQLQRFKIAPDARLALKMVLSFKTAANDIDGPVKACQDSFGTALGFNDNRVDELHVYRGPVDRKHPHCQAQLSIIRS